MKNYLYAAEYGLYIPITKKLLEELQRFNLIKIFKSEMGRCYWNHKTKK